jgi:hypothetical protein
MSFLSTAIVGPGSFMGAPDTTANTVVHPVGAAYDNASGEQAKRQAAQAAEQAATAKAQKLKQLQDAYNARNMQGMKKGGSVKSSASSRGDGIAARGKTRGRVV